MEHKQLPPNVIPEHYDLYVRPSSKDLRFEGTVSIKIDVREATADIILNAANLTFLNATLDSVAVAEIIVNGKEETAVLVFPETIQTGSHTLVIEYGGMIYEAAQGLFISRYGSDDDPKALLLTQLEPGLARHLLPCWDEPARKATFALAVAVPEGLTAVSNMPAEIHTKLPDGRSYVRFQKTPRMASYLPFLGLGEFERIEATSGKTTIGIVAKKGSAHRGQFALESAVKLLDFFRSYFGVTYPLPKLDMIAAPGGGGFSAMENWGAILYFEDQLLLHEDWSSEIDRLRVHIVVAHEMAHQWFGNLVTMDWWDNLWLNEGFASWMESKATDALHPEWTIWFDSEIDLQRTMEKDGKRTTHPVVTPVPSVAEVEFDDITYRKGRAVIRMIEEYLGEDAFREGVRAYMKRYQFSNTVTDNLWAELVRASGKEIKEIAGEFTAKAGLPLVRVEKQELNGGVTTVTLELERFSADEDHLDLPKWQIPIYARSAVGEGSVVFQLVTGSDPIEMKVAGEPPIKINAGQTAYYRSAYDEKTIALLAKTFNGLKPADQLGLLYDSWALSEGGKGDIATYLDLTRGAAPENDAYVWRQMASTFLTMYSLSNASPVQDRLRRYALSILKPAFATVGWDAKPEESTKKMVLREILIGALGQLGDEEVVNEANRRFDRFAAIPGDPTALPAVIRRSVLQVVALAADAYRYEVLHRMAKQETDSFSQNQLFLVLAWAKDPSLAKQTLDLALSDEPAKTTGPKMIANVAAKNPELAWHFGVANLDKLSSRLDDLQRHTFVPSLTAQATDPKLLDELKSFIANKVPKDYQAKAERSVAELSVRLRLIESILPKIDKWLGTQGK